MKKAIFFSLIVFFSNTIQAANPTETLELAVNRLIAVATDKTMDEAAKKQALSSVLSEEIDFNS